MFQRKFFSFSVKLTAKKREIELNLNFNNILLKRIKRTRQSKKQVYAAHLNNDNNENLLTFHELFLSLLSIKNYYFFELFDFSTLFSIASIAAAINQSFITKLSILFERLHRDILLSKLINYC